MQRKFFIPLLFLMLGLLSCGTKYPLDIPEEKWASMTRQEQLRAREKQAELELAREKRRAAEAKAREAEAIKWLKDKEASRKQARYGERIQCVLTKAEAYIWGEWRRIEPVALDIVKGMVLEFELSEANDNGLNFQQKAYAGFDGQTLSLCPEKDQVQRNDPSCARVLGTFEQYAKGIKSKIGVQDFLRGRIRCDLAPGKGMPERIIIKR
jgi:predicted small lipoprotein YifL